MKNLKMLLKVAILTNYIFIIEESLTHHPKYKSPFQPNLGFSVFKPTAVNGCLYPKPNTRKISIELTQLKSKE
jgi:hypothetical protein